MLFQEDIHHAATAIHEKIMLSHRPKINITLIDSSYHYSSTYDINHQNNKRNYKNNKRLNKNNSKETVTSTLKNKKSILEIVNLIEM